MKALRILLLMFMTFILLLMAGCPAHYDSKRSFSSRRHYYEAQRQHEIAPSVETQRVVEAARLEIAEANRLDGREIMVIEIFMSGILGISVYAFIHAGKRVHKISAA